MEAIKICLVSISLQTPERRREDILLKPDCIACSFWLTNRGQVIWDTFYVYEDYDDFPKSIIASSCIKYF